MPTRKSRNRDADRFDAAVMFDRRPRPFLDPTFCRPRLLYAAWMANLVDVTINWSRPPVGGVR